MWYKTRMIQNLVQYSQAETRMTHDTYSHERFYTKSHKEISYSHRPWDYHTRMKLHTRMSMKFQTRMKFANETRMNQSFILPWNKVSTLAWLSITNSHAIFSPKTRMESFYTNSHKKHFHTRIEFFRRNSHVFPYSHGIPEKIMILA